MSMHTALAFGDTKEKQKTKNMAAGKTADLIPSITRKARDWRARMVRNRSGWRTQAYTHISSCNPVRHRAKDRSGISWVSFYMEEGRKSAMLLVVGRDVERGRGEIICEVHSREAQKPHNGTMN